MSFFPRAFASEFAPVFRLLDDYASQVATSSSRAPAFNHCTANIPRTFKPRFDVKENKESYELFGELPGVQQQDINIEFTDATTLSIKGQRQTVREEGTRPSALAGDQVEQAKITDTQADKSAAAESDADWDTVTRAESESGSYHKATVEDDPTESGTATATPTHAETPQELAPAQEIATHESRPEGPKYWLSERTAGSFARTFSFPDRVDHEHVKASLKDGILSIVVPKAAIPASRRINIE